jgi:hypothetical protein
MQLIVLSLWGRTSESSKDQDSLYQGAQEIRQEPARCLREYGNYSTAMYTTRSKISLNIADNLARHTLEVNQMSSLGTLLSFIAWPTSASFCWVGSINELSCPEDENCAHYNAKHRLCAYSRKPGQSTPQWLDTSRIVSYPICRTLTAAPTSPFPACHTPKDTRSTSTLVQSTPILGLTKSHRRDLGTA